MNYASIDLGTNTVRLLVARRSRTGFDPIFSEHKITRLGEGMNKTGTLMPGAIKRTIKAVKYLKKQASLYSPSKIWVAATSAVREAKNRQVFIEQIKFEAGLTVDVISWEEEGRLMLLGVYHGLKDRVERGLVFDIGGGSTEFVLSKGMKPVDKAGVNLGVVRLSEKYPGKESIDDGEFHAMELEIGENILKVKTKLNAGKNIKLIGTAGTVTTIAALDLNLFPYDPERVNGHIITIKKANDLLTSLRRMTMTEKRALPSLERGREDLIVPGITIVKKIMEYFVFDEMTVSEYGLREGILLDRFK